MLIANELIALLAGESRVLLLGQWLIRALIFKVDWGNIQYKKMDRFLILILHLRQLFSTFLTQSPHCDLLKKD